MKKSQYTSPFKFLDSYNTADRDLFFGRDREIEEIYDKLFQSQMLLIYGASGTGKSSILNCGVANMFNEADWLPIHIRRGGNMRRSLFNQINRHTLTQVTVDENELMSNASLEKVLSAVFLDHFKPIYLIFDQFEELFIFGFKEEWLDFISAIKFLMERDLEVHFVFVMRGEYLEFLSEFEEIIPEFFDNRVRIEKMTRKNALECISGPTEHFPIKIEKGFEEKLLKKLSPDKSQIELTFLQVFLDKIYKTSVANQQTDEDIVFSSSMIDDLGQIGDVLAEFVDEQLFKMPDPKAALTVLKSFVSLQGTKVQRTLDEVLHYTNDIGQKLSVEKIEEILSEFVNKRILKEKDENDRFELRHDSLAQKIFEKITIQERELLDVKQFILHSFHEYEKRETLLNDDDLAYIALHERNLKLDKPTLQFIELSRQNSTKRRKQRRRRTAVIILILLLMVTSVIGFIYSQKQKANAEEQRQLAQRESNEATRQKAIAEQQSEEARLSELEAKKNAELAERERSRALAAMSEALVQKEIADDKSLQAEEAKAQANKNADEALKNLQLAERERQKSFTLRMLSLAKGLAVKSSQMVDAQLKGLLSLKAYEFNLENGGSKLDPDVFTALYRAQTTIKPPAERLYKANNLAISDLCANGDGMFAISTDGQLNLIAWNEESPVVTQLLATEYAFQSMDVYEDQMVIGTLFGELILLDSNGKTVHGTVSTGNASIEDVIITQNSIVAADVAGSLHFMDRKGQKLSVISDLTSLHTMTKKDNQLWVGGANGQLYELTLDGRLINQFALGPKSITTLISNGHLLIIGLQDGQILVWDTTQHKTIQVLPGHSAAITDLKLIPDANLLLSCSYDRSVRIWQLNDPALPAIVIQDRNHWITALQTGSKGKFFFTGENDGTIRKFDLDPMMMAQDICENLNRNLSTDEWSKYIGEDIPYQKNCADE